MKKILYIGSSLPWDITKKYSKSIASNKFEHSIIRQLSYIYKEDVSFLSVSNIKTSLSDAQSEFKIDQIINVSLIQSLDNNALVKVSRQMKMVAQFVRQWCKANKNDIKVIFMINSLPNLSLPLLLLQKKYRFKMVSFTIDSPFPYLNTKSGFNYLASKLYYNLGLKILRKFNGIVLLNELAYKELDLKIPYMVTQIGFDPNDYNFKKKAILETGQRSILVTYAGTLVDYNGIENLVYAFKECLQSSNIFLHIYGDGPMRDFVIENSTKSSNIYYHGIVENHEMLDKLSNSNIVINPRITKDAVNNFTFPSKLTEYMLSGATVLTTKINSIPLEYSDYLFFIEDESSNGIASSIKSTVEASSVEREEKIIKGKEFLYNSLTWECIILKIAKFLDDV